MERARIRHAPNVDVQSVQSVHDLANIARDGLSDDVESAAAIGRAQRLGQSGGAGGNDSVRVSTPGALDNTEEKRGGNFGHIAGYDQIPILLRGGKGRVDPGKRAAGRIYISDNRITKVTILLRIADQSHVPGGLMYLRRNVLNQRNSLKAEQSFVRTHTGTLAARKDKSRAFHGENDNIIGTHRAEVVWQRNKTIK